MTALLIAEELFLLTHDDESGKSRSASSNPGAAMAGAVLLDLAELGALKVDDRRKVAIDDEPAAHPLLAEAQAVIAGDRKDRSISHWVNGLPGKLRPLQDKVGRSLVDRGILGYEEGKALGIFTTKRWPERDPRPERDLRAGLNDVLARGTTPTSHQELLVPLLASLNMVNKLVEKDDRKLARETAKALTKAAKEGRLVSASVSQAIQATQTAVIAAVVTTSAAAGTAGST